VRLWLDGNFADVAGKVFEWAGRLRHLGLLGEMRWDTDYPPPARTGPVAAVRAAENAFTADSCAAIALLTLAASTGPSSQVLTVASTLDLAISFTGSTTAGLTWIAEELASSSRAPHPARGLRDEVVRLACPAGNFAALTSQPATKAVRTAWDSRRLAVARYATQLGEAGNQSPDDALLALVRDHHQRVNGPDHESWQLVARLARSAALAAIAQASP
jgi:thiopeptide-type bacteriocin biosynthesis protein